MFIDWSNVFKGRMQPMIDPNRVSESGQKAIAGLENSWNFQFKKTGHGMESYQSPRGVRITVEKARKSEPWLVADQPWEQSLGWVSILQEGGKYRAWYDVRLAQQSTEYTYQDGRAMELSGSALCYAESTDGMHWVKPKLGLIAFNGSKDNNLVSQLHFIGTIFRDDHGPAEERYKSFEFAEAPQEELAKSTSNMNKYCLYGLVSPDGYRWKRFPAQPLVRHFCDTQNVGGWDPLLKKYVGYFRDHVGGRAISRSETEDFTSWPHPTTILASGPEDGPSSDYYTNCYTTYPGDPSLRLLFPAMYHQDSDRVDIRMALSREGRYYNWVSHEPIIELGKPGQWDGGSIYASPDLVRLPDGRLALPFTAHPSTHNEAFFVGFYKDYSTVGKIAWALWDDGRLAGIQADGKGDFYTSSFTLGGDIEINARTAGGGSVVVEVWQGENLAVESVPFKGDKVWTPLEWKTKVNLSELRGKKVRLHFRLNKAKVFGYRLADKTQEQAASPSS